MPNLALEPSGGRERRDYPLADDVSAETGDPGIMRQNHLSKSDMLQRQAAIPLERK